MTALQNLRKRLYGAYDDSFKAILLPIGKTKKELKAQKNSIINTVWQFQYHYEVYNGVV
ncbi:hypothetical protein GCM10025859_25950 [Alicyclobacillus fastidiosus]|nr:hypothetical protein GCM10025859_25950 [Alicyclobacillus fastidiosus]